ncbi:hypothetical protein [Microbacterium sp. CIAB417]|uniref:hypothetical protein n=1 Tax=Microbacterium sp. CIAB417 TaxID=2860287 RepID=UPI001FAC31F5|nr:hypothetical protein [Microbacterium sp. CIAB417]
METDAAGRFPIEGGPFIKPTWIVRTTAPASVALDAFARGLVDAKYRMIDSAPSMRRLKAGSALRFIASNVVPVELVRGMRTWGFEARATLSAETDAGRTRLVIMLDGLAHGSITALPYTADALARGAAALLAAGYEYKVASLTEGKGLRPSDAGR